MRADRAGVARSAKSEFGHLHDAAARQGDRDLPVRSIPLPTALDVIERGARLFARLIVSILRK